MSVLLGMENSLEKLKCLEYETHFIRQLRQKPVSREEFCSPALNTSLQFNHFVELIKWLIGSIRGAKDGLQLDEYDDPNTIVGKMMLVLQDLGFDANFPVTKLKQAHGEAAVAVLDFLTDKSLEAQGFLFQHPVYQVEKNAKERGGENGFMDDEEEIVDEVESFDDDESCSAENILMDATKKEILQHDSSHQIIESEIDPVEWRTELERVAPRLQSEWPPFWDLIYSLCISVIGHGNLLTGPIPLQSRTRN